MSLSGEKPALLDLHQTNGSRFVAACEDAVALWLRRNKRPREATSRAVSGVTLTGASTPIWYVTFEVRKRGVLPKQRSPRETKTFATEAEAKIFAGSKLDEGLIVYAGTINPHTPKRLVASSKIYAWLAGEGADDDPLHGKDEA